ncbi:MAG: glycosyltransferase [bacterium]|nr:glycosyltransferase [bacterium]
MTAIDKLNLLLVADQYYPPTLGGSAITLRRLAHGLAERGHRVTVLAPSAQGLRSYVEQDGNTVVIRARALKFALMAARKSTAAPRLAVLPEGMVRETIERLQPDLVQIVTPTVMGAPAWKHARRLGIPVVASNHGIPDNLIPFPYSRDWKAYKIWDSVYWTEVVNFLNQCDFVTAPTNLACDMLTERGITQQPVPISNGVDLTLFRAPSPEEKLAVRKRFKVPTDRPVVLYVGRLALEKRLEVLVDALPEVHRETGCHALFVGTGVLDVKAMVAERGLAEHATFTGLIDDQLLPLVYRAADVLVLPSESELQGMVLLEAAASGLPLVGANALAIPEIVHHGENGFLHAPGQPKDLAARLVSLLSDEALRTRMGARSLELVQHHSLDESLTQMETIYRDLVARYRAAHISEV